MLKQFLSKRYPRDSILRIEVQQFVLMLCERHIRLGFADRNFEKDLCCGSEHKYWQRLSEALLVNELLVANLDVQPSRNKGPDILVKYKGRNIWIEVICPEPRGVPENWLRRELCHTMPSEEILLRWTSAIKEKSERLLGNREKNISGYLQDGVVDPDDSYVIAVNGRLLRDVYCNLMGISGYPFAVEAVFEVGSRQLIFDKISLQVLESGYQHRPFIPKPLGESVPANMFLDPAFQAVSAIWATDIDDSLNIDNLIRMSVIHNPLAIKNRIEERFLPASTEYVATVCEEGGYLLNDRLAQLNS